MSVPTATNPTGSNEAAALPGIVKINNSALTGSDSEWYIAAYNVSDQCVGIGTILTDGGVNYIVNLAINKPSSTDLTFIIKLGNTQSNTTYSHANTFTWSNQNGADLPGYIYNSEFNFTQDTGGGGGGTVTVPTATNPTGSNEAAALPGIVKINNSALTGSDSEWYIAAYNVSDQCVGIGTILTDGGVNYIVNLAINKPSSTDLTFIIKLGNTQSNTTYSHTNTFTWSNQNGADLPGYIYNSEFNFTQDAGGGGGGGDTENPVITSLTTGTNLVENSGAGQTVYTIVATDNVGVTSYSIGGTDASLLTVNSSTGVVTLNANPNYETKSSYSFTAIATDAIGNNSDPKTVTFSISNANEPATGKPGITSNGNVSSPLVGNVLTATAGNIADPDGLGAFSYQWKRAGANISSATSLTYTIVSADIGSTITVSVSFTDGGGFAAGPLTSDPTGTVAAPNNPATGVPTIAGTPALGQTLTANTNNIQDTDGIKSTAYQWKRDGVNISGATNSTYILTGDDIGTTITVTVTITDNNDNVELPRNSAGVVISALDDKIYFWTQYNDASNNTAIYYGIYNTSKISGVQLNYDLSLNANGHTTTVADVSYNEQDQIDNDTMIYKKEWPIRVINNRTDTSETNATGVANKQMLFAGSMTQSINGMNTGVFAVVRGNIILTSIAAMVDHNSNFLTPDKYAIGEPANPPEITEPGGRPLGDINYDGSFNDLDIDIMTAYLLNDTESVFNVYAGDNVTTIYTDKTAIDIIGTIDTDGKIVTQGLMSEFDILTYIDVNNNNILDVGDLVRMLSKRANPNFSITNGV